MAHRRSHGSASDSTQIHLRKSRPSVQMEVQGSGEESTFSEAELNTTLELARGGIGELVAKQRAVIG